MSIKEFSKTSDVPLDFTGVCSIYGGTYHYKNGLIHNENDPAIIDSFGNKFWCFNGQFHRIDNPAIEYASGRKEWYIDGKRYSEEKSFKNFFKAFDYVNDVPEDFTGIAKIKGCIYYYEDGEHHRENGHAVEYKDGKKVWYLKGKRHRENGPAIEQANGSKEWFVNGARYREGGPAIEYQNGYKAWYKNNKPHREDGPAIEHPNGDKEWWLNNQLHRLDGPAIEYANGDKSWHIDGKEYLEKDFTKKVADMNIIKFPRLYNVPKDFTGHCVITSANANCYYKNGVLHREDGPAYEKNDGHKEWHLNGKLHREDGPAKEYPTGSKYWYQNGKLHREGGHAFEDPETKTWWINDKRHCLDGPAVECADGTKEWWIDGENYSEEEFTKKVVIMSMKEFDNLSYVPKDFTGVCKIKRDKSTHYYKDGKHHREDGPAIEYSHGAKEWYLNGKRHRIDGPAVEYANGGKEWWVEGKKYSEEEFTKKVASMNVKEFELQGDVPKDFTGICKIKDIKQTRYYKDGLLHREDGPAAIKEDGSNWWWSINGKPHREDGHAVQYNGNKHWYQHGERHREDGPAIEYANGSKSWYIEGESYSEEEFNKKIESMNLKEFLHLDEIPKNFTGVCKIKDETRYYKMGGFHREDGPAYIYDGKFPHKIWFINNEYHRDDGPACEYPDGTKHWYIQGHRHRTDGPAIESKDGNKEWWLNGKRHREDGPAIEHADGYKEWWINGRREYKIDKQNSFIRRNSNKALYRIAAEQSTNIIKQFIISAISKSTTIENAHQILNTNVGKILLQSAIGLVLNDLNYNSIHIEKITEEMLISSITNVENTIIDYVINQTINNTTNNNLISQDLVRIQEQVHESDLFEEINNYESLKA